MAEIYVGCALLDHRDKCKGTLYGRVIYVDKNEDLACVVRFPGKNKAGYQKNYVMAPVFMSLNGLQAQVNSLHISVTEFSTPSHWLLTPAQLRENKNAGLAGRTRRDLLIFR